MITKEKKISKIAKIKHIDHNCIKKPVFLICKVLESTSVSESEDLRNPIQKKVPEKKLTSSNLKSLKKEKNTRFSDSQESSNCSQFMPDKAEVRVSETKNISTSYGKMILRFMENNKESISPILAQKGLTYNEFQKALEYFNRHMFSVSDLRKLWLDQNNKFAQVMRIFSMNFLRKYSFSYIFNSRIKMYERNLKYRHKIVEGVRNPQGFNMLKDF